VIHIYQVRGPQSSTRQATCLRGVGTRATPVETDSGRWSPVVSRAGCRSKTPRFAAFAGCNELPHSKLRGIVSVLARHSVLDTPAPYLIRGNPAGPSGYRLPPVWRTRGKPRGM